MFVPVGNQKHKIIITFLISIPLIYSQMLVQLFINDGHFGYITKLQNEHWMMGLSMRWSKCYGCGFFKISEFLIWKTWLVFSKKLEKPIEYTLEKKNLRISQLFCWKNNNFFPKENNGL